MKKSIRQRAEEGGLWFMVGVMLAVSAVFLSTYIKTVRDVSPVDLPGDTSVQVIPREVGTGFDVMKIVNDPSAHFACGVMTDAPQGGNRYFVSRGLEQINWPDSPPGQHDGARYTHPNSKPGFIKEDGTVAEIGEQIGEDVVITKQARDVIVKKAGKCR